MTKATAEYVFDYCSKMKLENDLQLVQMGKKSIFNVIFETAMAEAVKQYTFR